MLDPSGWVLHQEDAGIGRGGLREKTSMADLVTPTGSFSVDLILSAGDSSRMAILPSLRSRYAADPAFGPLVASPQGLARLFDTMNRLDFDGDAAPDRAYGVAYIGLSSASAVTGPKMHWFRGQSYWFSIALHGTPSPAALGKATSGGCVHLSAALLERLLRSRHLQLGSVVVIADGPPPERPLRPPPPRSPPPSAPPRWFGRWPKLPRLLGWREAVAPPDTHRQGSVGIAPLESSHSAGEGQAGSGELLFKGLLWFGASFVVACCSVTLLLPLRSTIGSSPLRCLFRCRSAGDSHI